MTFGPEGVLRMMQEHVPFNRMLGIRGRIRRGGAGGARAARS